MLLTVIENKNEAVKVREARQAREITRTYWYQSASTIVYSSSQVTSIRLVPSLGRMLKGARSPSTYWPEKGKRLIVSERSTQVNDDDRTVVVTVNPVSSLLKICGDLVGKGGARRYRAEEEKRDVDKAELQQGCEREKARNSAGSDH